MVTLDKYESAAMHLSKGWFEDIVEELPGGRIEAMKIILADRNGVGFPSTDHIRDGYVFEYLLRLLHKVGMIDMSISSLLRLFDSIDRWHVPIIVGERAYRIDEDRILGALSYLSLVQVYDGKLGPLIELEEVNKIMFFAALGYA